MVNREPGGIEPFLLTPEYWQGHRPDDDCSAKHKGTRIHTARQTLRILKDIRPVLIDYFSVPNKTPIREFNTGEYFMPDQFADGTVVGFTSESLHLAPGYFGINLPPYARVEKIGVVYGYDGEKRRETGIMVFDKDYLESIQATSFSPIIRMLGLPYSLPIQVGEVSHSKIRGKKDTDKFERLTDLAVYHIGKGAQQEVRRGSLFPRLGVVFRPKTGTI